MGRQIGAPGESFVVEIGVKVLSLQIHQHVHGGHEESSTVTSSWMPSGDNAEERSAR